jgi:hypothetical protein
VLQAFVNPMGVAVKMRIERNGSLSACVPQARFNGAEQQAIYVEFAG